MPTQAEKVRIFRAMHRPGTPFGMPDIWSPGTAKTMAEAGFRAISTTSGGLALDHGHHQPGRSRTRASHCSRAPERAGRIGRVGP